MKTLQIKERISSFFEKKALRVLSLCSRTEAIPGKGPEIIATAAYIVLHLIMAIFHEPWYDEAVSWQIARCASIRDILFEIPHYEGHPPLWHLILVPFAKTGAPYELSLTLVSLLFAGTAVCLIIWRSPLPRLVRLLLPFTYFFFYQYGVISRPYCVMMLAFVLLAMYYHARNTKPGRYALCLMLLCLTSAFGIVIAGGLAIVWVWEIWNKQNIGMFLKSIFRDKRVWWLAALLAMALLLIAEIMPRGNTYATSVPEELEKNGFCVRLLYTFFGAPADMGLTNLFRSRARLKHTPFEALPFTLTCMVGAVIMAGIIAFGRRKRTAAAYVVPHLLWAGFSAMVYITNHHMGIPALFFVFWLWISCSADTEDKIFCEAKNPTSSNKKSNKLFNKMGDSVEQGPVLKQVAVFVCAAMMVVSLYWAASASLKDVFFTYAPGREEAAFINEYNLDQYSVLVRWDIYTDKDGNILSMDINHHNCADNVSPYLDSNIFLNFNYGNDQVCYSTHKRASEQETAEALKKWAQITPDVLFMTPELEAIYGDDLTIEEDYTLVYSRVWSMFWKGWSTKGCANIHVRNSLAEELGLPEIEEDQTFVKDLLDALSVPLS